MALYNFLTHSLTGLKSGLLKSAEPVALKILTQQDY